MSAMMDDEHFWGLIEGVSASDQVDGRCTNALASKLARLPIPRIASFQRALVARADELLTWPLWEAAEVIHRERCSEDSFLDFRLWIIA
jgi:hypothetical protein